MKRTLLVLACAAAPAQAATPYWLRVVDADTGRGVPLVEVTVEGGSKWTDSNGVVVLDDARLQGKQVSVRAKSPGYSDDAREVSVKSGTHAEVKLKRLNIGERLYRTTGANIYGNSVRVGLKSPIAQPLINTRVTGQDTVIMAPYRGKLFWCWGDTDGEPRDDGKKRFNGKVTCATSEPPGKGGLDPSVGIDFTYFKRDDGFTRMMVPLKERGLVWIEALFTVPDTGGRERLLATYTIQTAKSGPTETGIVQFDDAAGEFRKIANFPLRPRHVSSHPFRTTVDGKDYLYLFPLYRVAYDWKSILDPGAYEAYTCLKSGAKLDMANPPLERDASGKLVCGWKRDAEWIPGDRERTLVSRGAIPEAQANFALINTDTGKPTSARGDSVTWNPYRKKWIMFSKDQGTVYYSEADQPHGPWVKAKPVITHLPFRLYNVVQHALFDADGGRSVYLEGTFTNKLSKSDVQVPDYHYNNIMYRVDLSDPRLQAARIP